MDKEFIKNDRDLINTYMKEKMHKYSKDIEDTCINFIFLKNDSMIYPYIYFNSYWDAMIDAVNQGEDIDTIVSLVFRETFDQPIIKKKLLSFLNQ